MAKRAFPKTTKQVPTFFTSRNITEGYIVARADLWKSEVREDSAIARCDKPPYPSYSRTVDPDRTPGGHLWTTREAAEKRARQMLSSSNPPNGVLIFKVVAVAETVHAPITITEVA